MPCYTDPPTDAEQEATLLRELLKETKGLPFDLDSSIISSGQNLQKHTRELCAWCKNQPASRIKSMSLELQMWWRDHQKQDAQHAREAAARRKKADLAAIARKKLTPEERRALGID